MDYLIIANLIATILVGAFVIYKFQTIDKIQFKRDWHDEIYEHVKEWTLKQSKISASIIQKQFMIGYARAERIIAELISDKFIEKKADGIYKINK